MAMLDEEAQEDLRANKNLGVYKGALYESIVREALTKCGYGTSIDILWGLLYNEGIFKRRRGI